MKIGISLIAYNTGGFTVQQLESIIPHTQHEIVPYLFLHCNRNQELIDECEFASQHYHCKYFPYGINRGFAKSMNEGIHYAYDEDNCDIALCLSQDVWFNSSVAFDIWVEKCIQYLDKKLIISLSTCPQDGAPFGAWIHTKSCWDKIGCLDENFFPAQSEDVDLSTRAFLLTTGKHGDMQKADAYMIRVLADATHPGMLVRNDPLLLKQQLYITAPLNYQYYYKKWGGLGGYEIFLYPFNNPNIGYYIPFSLHNKPYGTLYERTDQDMVKF